MALVTCGARPLFALLRLGNADPAGGVTEPLGGIVTRLRQQWPGLGTTVRADCAYAREELLAWCEDNNVDHCIGLARNSRLVERIGSELAEAQAQARRRGRPARRFAEFFYTTEDELVTHAARCREGRASDRQGQPPLRRHPAANCRRRAKDSGCLINPDPACAVERRTFLAGANPARQLSLQPVVTRAVYGGDDMD